MAVPRAPVFAVVQLHGHAMLGAVWCFIGRLDHEREPLQHRFEALQQPALVAVAQGQLHLAAAELKVHVDTRWRFRQRRGGDRRRGLRWSRPAGRCGLAVRWRVQLRPDPCGHPLGQARGDAVTVDERVASLTSVSKPCMQVSLHTAPQLLFPCHGYVAFAP